MSAEEIKALERNILEIMNKGKKETLAAWDKYCAKNYVLHDAGGMDWRGPKEYRQFINAFYDAFPDIHFALEDLIVEGDKAVMRFTITGTHKGKFMDIPPTNKKIKLWEISIDRIVGGKFVESWIRADTLGLMQQLGVVPTSGKG